MTNLYNYKAKCTAVIDGDTIDADVDLGFDVWIKTRFRLLGIDTPETYGVKKDSAEYAAGMLAKARTTELLLNKEIVLVTEKDRTEKYGRYLATVYVGGVNVNETLIKEGLAKIYK
jgi:endonuclease YncB( thermonuclease family)